MQSYADAHGRLPPAVVYGEDGTPLHSWRVLILPHIEQQELFNEFKLNEPWDSPHNLALLPRMPATYAPPSGKQWKVPKDHTVCHVLVGKGTAFEGRLGLRLGDDFPVGTTRTLLIVEAGKPVPWTMPEDLDYDPDGPLPGLEGLFKDGFRACFVDGSTSFIRAGTSEAKLRPLIVHDSGESDESEW